MQVVHLGTEVKCVFGIIDDNGNLVNKHPITIDVVNFQKESYEVVISKFLDVRSKLKGQYEPTVTPMQSLPPEVIQPEVAKKVKK